jgi:hypothetical protein
MTGNQIIRASSLRFCCHPLEYKYLRSTAAASTIIAVAHHSPLTSISILVWHCAIVPVDKREGKCESVYYNHSRNASGTSMNQLLLCYH